MAKQKKQEIPGIPTSPQWETRSLAPFSDGRIPGVDGSMWLYGSVPMSPILDAKTARDITAGGAPLHSVFEELSSLATPGINRQVSKSTYREFHTLLLNVPTYFQAPESVRTRAYLNREFRDRLVMRRELLVGVKLTPSAFNPRANGMKAAMKNAVDSFLYTLMYTGTMPSEFDADFEEIRGIFSRSGISIPDKSTLRWADSWWNHGRAKSIPVLPHDNHLHLFNELTTKHYVEDRLNTESCIDWPEEMPDQQSITFTGLNNLDLDWEDVQSDQTRWAPMLLNAGARVISVRGLVEPAKVTRNQLESQQNRITQDMNEYFEKNKTPREEQELKRERVASKKSLYASGEAPATLVDCSVIVGFDGDVEDLRKIQPSMLDLNHLTDLQAPAWYETMLCSSVKANPLIQEFPDTAIAYAGMSNLSRVGDEPRPNSALLGFTEQDGQPVWVTSDAASRGDSFPLGGVFGSTGSGKSQVLLWLAHQWGLAGVPQAVVDPKVKSDFTDAVRASNGSVNSFDDFVNSDGPLDPIRYAQNPGLGIQLASDMLARVRPLSSMEMDRYETPLANAIRYGVENGAQATGQALLMAADAGHIDRKIVDDIIGFARTYPMFRATFGLQPGASPLRIGKGISLFKVGESQFETPPPGLTDIRDATPAVRTSVNVMRQIVRASILNLAGRGGVLHIDEEWVYELAAPDELVQLGRLARSQNVLVLLYTQTPKGPLDLGLGGFMSRGFIGHVKSEGEDTSQADAALRLFGASNPDILGRVTAMEKESGKNNWNSLKPLWKVLNEEGDRELLRPAVFYHADIEGQLAPVIVEIPQSFFELSSTNPDDIARREAKNRQLAYV